jgi:hypothetical protein
VIKEQDIEEVSHEEDHQIEHEFPCEYTEEELFDETHHVEILIHEEDPHEDEAPLFAPPFDEVIQASIPPAHEEENMVIYNPSQVFDVVSFHDSESEYVIEEPLDALNPSWYNESNDVIENIDDFIDVGRCKWDMTCYGFNGDTIYDIEGHFQFPLLEKPYVIATDSYVWQSNIPSLPQAGHATPRTHLLAYFESIIKIS